jgi:poly-gamma-glutamate capsule biosynthesis protein CapA/YwtB (metallophosphatase superfamily)
MRARPACTFALLVTLALTGACSTGPEAQPESTTSAPATARASDDSPEPSTSTPPALGPLALVTHPTRPAIDISSAVAADLLAGRVDNWSDLGAASGPLRLVAATGVAASGADQVSSAEAVLTAVGRDGTALGAVPASAVGPGVRVLRVDRTHPLRRPAAYPLTTPDELPPTVTTATVVGDVMLARRVGSRMTASGDFAAALRPTAQRLAGADLTVGNLEGTLSRLGRPQQGGDSFGADPRVRRGLLLAGFDVLSLANNHTGDYGLASLVDTVRRVRETGIVPVGAGADLAEARKPAVVVRNGVRFGVVAFDAIGETPAARAARPGAFRLRMQPRTGPLVPSDLERVLDTVRELRTTVDVVMVLPHWGTQYTTRTVADQRRVGRALVEAGADIVVGGHPHWVQGVELHRGAPIAYSLGNYVFDMDFSRETQEGAFLELVFWGSDLKAAELVPVRIGADFAPRVASGAGGQAILDRVWGASGRPLSGTHRRPS